MKIQLYGQPNWNYEYLKMSLKEMADKSGVNLNIEEVTNWSIIIKECIETIPTVKVGTEEYLSKGNDESINKYIKKVFSSILEKGNYGDLPVLIVPVDFSDHSKNAFLYAVQLAEQINAIIKVVHIHYPEECTKNKFSLPGSSHVLERKKQLEEFMAHNTSYWINESISSPLIEDEFIIGLPIRTIVELSNMYKNAMVIMSTTGAGSNMKKRFGSVSTEVAQKASCPVLLVPPGVNEFKFNHICYALDDVETDALATGFLAPFAKKTEAVISLAHISKEENDYQWYDLMNYWKLSFPKNKIALYRYSEKDVVEGLQNFCQNNKVDLLVMSARKRGFPKSIIHKSFTQASAIHTTVPLLILHPEKALGN